MPKAVFSTWSSNHTFRNAKVRRRKEILSMNNQRLCQTPTSVSSFMSMQSRFQIRQSYSQRAIDISKQQDGMSQPSRKYDVCAPRFLWRDIDSFIEQLGRNLVLTVDLGHSPITVCLGRSTARQYHIVNRSHSR